MEKPSFVDDSKCPQPNCGSTAVKLTTGPDAAVWWCESGHLSCDVLYEGLMLVYSIPWEA